jgi:hypothetical protein
VVELGEKEAEETRQEVEEEKAKERKGEEEVEK